MSISTTIAPLRIVNPAELSPVDRANEARTNEAVAHTIIAGVGPYLADGVTTTWSYVAGLNCDAIEHHAFVGKEAQARKTHAELPPYASDARFRGGLAIWQAFNRPSDRKALIASLGNNPDVPADSLQALALIAHDLEYGRNYGAVSAAIDAIPRPTEAAIARIMTAPDVDAISAIRDGFVFEPRPLYVDSISKTKLRVHPECNTDKARVYLAAAMRVPELHQDAMAAVTELSRPDNIRGEVAAYLQCLLESGRRDAIQDVLQATTRQGDPHEHVATLGSLAQASLDTEDIERFRQGITTIDNDSIGAQKYGQLAHIYSQIGDTDEVRRTIKDIEALPRQYFVAYGQYIALMGLFRSCLLDGQLNEATQTYSRFATGEYKTSASVTGRLMLARFYRMGHPDNLLYA